MNDTLILINLITAWLSVVLGAALSVIYLLRKLRWCRRNAFCSAVNRRLRRIHKPLGIALIVTALIHGLISSTGLLNFSMGTVALVLAVALGLNFYLRKRLKAKRGWIFYHRVLTLVFVAAVLMHFAEVAPFQLGRATVAPYTLGDVERTRLAERMDFGRHVFADGVYGGEAEGFGGILRVEIEIAGGRLIRVDVIDHSEQYLGYFYKAVKLLPGEIVREQSLAVDGISGATWTSVGIMNAVIDAAQKATDSVLPAVVLPESARSQRH